MSRLAAWALALLTCACATTSGEIPLVATGRVASDFDTYRLDRVGLVPLDGEDLGLEHNHALRDAFHAELSRATPFELVPLSPTDLQEVRDAEPHRRGLYDTRTIIEVARRYHLDAILFGTVYDRQFYPPQRIAVQMDMVSAETGLVIWEASVHLDASDPRVRAGLEAWQDEDQTGQENWEVVLISPARFAGFAAWQIASLL